jgi:HSP20 family molecular chaperone IbpA
MAITPTRATESRVSASQAQSSRNRLRPEEVAQVAGSGIPEQVAAAQKLVDQAKSDAEAEVARVREDTETQTLAEIDRRETMLENERAKGYEALRELQQQQQAELSRLRREGEAALEHLKEHYRTTTNAAQFEGERELKQTRAARTREVQTETTATANEVEMLRRDHVDKVSNQLAFNEARETELRESAKTDLERKRIDTNAAIDRSRQAYEEKFERIQNETMETLDSVGTRANREVRQVRQDTAQKLAAYSSRQRDPFYKLVDVGASLQENDDGYVLTATIPPQEQQHVTAVVRGDNLVVSGYRRNEERLEPEPGHSQSTSSYQSFQESFPLSVPVDSKRLVYEFEGDRLIVRVPKKGDWAKRDRVTPRAPDKLRLERPEFPKNLVLAPDTPAPYTPDTPGAPRRGSRPLG